MGTTMGTLAEAVALEVTGAGDIVEELERATGFRAVARDRGAARNSALR